MVTRISRRQVLRVAAFGFGAAALGLLSACGQSGAPAAATAAPQATANPTAAPAQGAAASSPAPQATSAAAAATGAAPTAAVAAGAKQLVFGAPLGITGPNAVEGKLTKNGYDLWVSEINKLGGVNVGGTKYSVSIKYYDDASKPDQSAQLTERLITQDNIKLIFGPYGSPASFQDSSICEKYQAVMVEGNGAAENIFNRGYKYSFATLSPAKDYAAVMLDMAVNLDPKPTSVAILSANDDFSVEVADGAKAFSDAHGLKVATYQKYPANSSDLSSVVTLAKGANADIMLNSGHLPESLAIMKAAKELDYSPKLFCFTVGPTTPDFLKALKADAENVVASTQWTATEKYQGTDIFGTPQKYAEAYKAAYGDDPDYHAADGTSVGVAFQAALEKAGATDPSRVRDALAGLDIMTFYGRIKFDSRGINTAKPMAVQQIQGGKLVTVWPADVAEAKPRYPTPEWKKRS